MSDAPAQKAISLAEINGRIGELEVQRDNALARCAKIAGEKAEAIDLVQILTAEVERLRTELKARGGAAPAAGPNYPVTLPAPAGAEAAAL